MKSVILGAKGQLGRDLLTVFGETGDVHGFDLPELDIAEPSAVKTVLQGHREPLCFLPFVSAPDNLSAGCRQFALGDCCEPADPSRRTCVVKQRRLCKTSLYEVFESATQLVCRLLTEKTYGLAATLQLELFGLKD